MQIQGTLPLFFTFKTFPNVDGVSSNTKVRGPGSRAEADDNRIGAIFEHLVFAEQRSVRFINQINMVDVEL